MSMLNPARWLLYGALVIAVLFGIKALDQSRQAIGYDKAQAEQTARALLASEAARNRETAWQAQLTKANQDAQTRQAKLAADVAHARAAADSLRNTVTALRANLSTATRDSLERYAGTGAELFVECAEAYSGMAGEADKLWSDRKTLIESWPK